MEWVIVAIAVVVAVIFAVRHCLLKNALRATVDQLAGIEEDVLQNRRVYLSVPDKDLEALAVGINQVIRCFQEARIQSDRRERAFQEQIEAISHDLRTPLTVIVGYLSMMSEQHKRGSLDDRELTEMLDVLQRKAGGMERLVNQFYEYSKLIAKDVALSCEAVDMGKVVRETLLNNVFLLEQARIEVMVSIDEKPLWIAGDAGALERVVTNLLQNVARYAKSKLQIRVIEREKTVQLQVVNDTEVLKENDMCHLFDRFYAGDQARPTGSSGLGLTIAKGLVEEMGGTMDAGILPVEDDDAQTRWIRFNIVLNKIGA